jgi:hypothetical protein
MLITVGGAVQRQMTATELGDGMTAAVAQEKDIHLDLTRTARAQGTSPLDRVIVLPMIDLLFVISGMTGTAIEATDPVAGVGADLPLEDRIETGTAI